MRLKVVDGPVRQNIELFLKILRHVDHRHLKKVLTAEKMFKAWVNRETGQFFINEVSRESSILGQKDWKEVEVCCFYDPEQGEICFLIEEPEEKNKQFQCDDLTPAAFAIMRETLKVLNAAINRLKGPSDLETKMSVISKIEVDSGTLHFEKSILIDAWHPSDRLQAEAILWDKPEGTYLFRKDIYAEMLEEQLQQHLKRKVKCFTLTYSQPNRKFCDLTIVHYDGLWLIYNDDPSLDEDKFHDLLDLLKQMKGILKFPLYH